MKRVLRGAGERFREARLSVNVDRVECAALLRVSARTVRNWERGVTRPPYSTFKLLRILRGFELPGDAWRGWYLKGDTLWSPEGKPFRPFDLGWWSLTVSMARAWTRGIGLVAASSVGVGTGRAAARHRPLDLNYGHMATRREKCSQHQARSDKGSAEIDTHLTHMCVTRPDQRIIKTSSCRQERCVHRVGSGAPPALDGGGEDYGS